MMGSKNRVFEPLVTKSVEGLVPKDHFYRHLERTVDLTFVRDLVKHLYAKGGRPSIDPVVFFKLQLAMFFEGMRSERQLERVGADRLSVRWYLGYDFHEPLPDHSSLTRIRERLGIPIFRKFFEAIVERCRDAGLVWGKELYADATLIEANADRDMMLPRFAVDSHLRHLFAPDTSQIKETPAAMVEQLDVHQDVIPVLPLTQTGEANQDQDEQPGVTLLPAVGNDLSSQRLAELLAHNQTRHDWYASNGAPDRSIKRGGYQRTIIGPESKTICEIKIRYDPGSACGGKDDQTTLTSECSIQVSSRFGGNQGSADAESTREHL